MSGFREKLKTGFKGSVLGTSALGMVLSGGAHSTEEKEAPEPSEPGAVIHLDEDNGMLMRDWEGKPAFVQYFDSLEPQDRYLTVSIMTTDTMPQRWQEYYAQAENPPPIPRPEGMDPERYEQLKQNAVPLLPRMLPDPETIHPIDARSVGVIRDFFREFEELTGIRVIVTENGANADVTIGGFDAPNASLLGFASFPQGGTVFPEGQLDKGILLLNNAYMQKHHEARNPEAIKALVSHEFGHNLGLLHPHSSMVHTEMTPKQEEAVARMSYNGFTFPPIAGTTTDTGFGPLEIFRIRDALTELGMEPPRINTADDNYLLTQLASKQHAGTHKGAGSITFIPALSIVDNGGRNSLQATDGDDLLVTEAGYCGLLKHDERQITLTRYGQAYCLVEGEFSVVRSGDGNDLILTANGEEQTVYLGTGDKEVALVHEEVGDKTIVDEGADSTTLTLHYSLFRNADVVAMQKGDDIALHFYAPSGREVGSLTLVGQGVEGQGIDQFRVIDDNGQTLAQYEVDGLHTAAEWQREIASPVQNMVEQKLLAGLVTDIERAKQGVAGTVEGWARPEMVPEEPYYPEDAPLPSATPSSFVDRVAKSGTQSQEKTYVQREEERRQHPQQEQQHGRRSV